MPRALVVTQSRLPTADMEAIPSFAVCSHASEPSLVCSARISRVTSNSPKMSHSVYTVVPSTAYTPTACEPLGSAFATHPCRPVSTLYRIANPFVAVYTHPSATTVGTPYDSV